VDEVSYHDRDDPLISFLLVAAVGVMAVFTFFFASAAKERGVVEGYCEGRCEIKWPKGVTFKVTQVGECLCVLNGVKTPLPARR
jgi:hypothetical protein